MANAIFLLHNLADEAGSLAASTEAATMAAGNLQNAQRGVKWRSDVDPSPDDESTVDVTLASGVTLDYAAAVDSNCDVTLQGWSDSLGGAASAFGPTTRDLATYANAAGTHGAGASANMVTTHNTLLWDLGAQTARYWRFTFDNSDDGYHEAGRIFLGMKVQPTKNVQFGWSSKLEDRSRPVETLSGARYRQSQRDRQSISARWQWLSDADRADFLTRLREHGARHPFIFSLFPDGGDLGTQHTTLYGSFSGVEISNPFHEQSNLALTISEEL